MSCRKGSPVYPLTAIPDFALEVTVRLLASALTLKVTQVGKIADKPGRLADAPVHHIMRSETITALIDVGCEHCTTGKQLPEARELPHERACRSC